MNWNFSDDTIGDLIAALPIGPRGIVEGMGDEMAEAAFTISGVESHDKLSKIRDLLASVGRGGKGSPSWEKAQKEIARELEEDLGDEADRRSELILRTVVNRARGLAAYRQFQADADIFPYLEYRTQDSEARKSHSALNGKIFPVKHAIWQRIFPPWEWGCRCYVVGRSKREINDLVDREKELAPEDRSVFTPDLADAIYQGQRLPGGQMLSDSEEKYASPARTGMTLWKPEELATRYARQGDHATQTSFDQLLSSPMAGHGGERPAITAEERRQENEALRAALPPRRNPVNALSVNVIQEETHALAAEKATLLIDQVHEVGGDVLPVRLHDSVFREGALGTHSIWEGEGQIGIRREGNPTPVLAALHEFGHHFQPHLDIKPLLDHVQSTQEWLELQLAHKSGYLSRKDYDYYRDDEEVWARAYAQYIAIQTGDAEALNQLDRSSRNHYYLKWSDGHGLTKAVSQVLRSAGWL